MIVDWNYGDSEAAVYLAQWVRNNPKYSRRISRHLSFFCKKLKHIRDIQDDATHFQVVVNFDPGVSIDVPEEIQSTILNVKAARRRKELRIRKDES